MSGNTQLFEELKADHEGTDPGTTKKIRADRDRAVIPIVSGASLETGSLADPEIMGQELTLCFKTDGGGNRVITADTAINETGNNTLTFSDAGEMIALRAIQDGTSIVWRVMANDGVALSTV